MNQMNNSNATPKKDTGTKGMDTDTRIQNDVKDDEFEIEQPNPSVATPDIPSEMPAREMK